MILKNEKQSELIVRAFVVIFSLPSVLYSADLFYLQVIAIVKGGYSPPFVYITVTTVLQYFLYADIVLLGIAALWIARRDPVIGRVWIINYLALALFGASLIVRFIGI